MVQLLFSSEIYWIEARRYKRSNRFVVWQFRLFHSNISWRQSDVTTIAYRSLIGCGSASEPVVTSRYIRLKESKLSNDKPVTPLPYQKWAAHFLRMRMPMSRECEGFVVHDVAWRGMWVLPVLTHTTVKSLWAGLAHVQKMRRSCACSCVENANARA